MDRRNVVLLLAVAILVTPCARECRAQFQDLQLLGVDSRTPVQGGGANPLTASSLLVDGGSATFLARGSSEGSASLTLTSRAMKEDAHRVVVEATVTVSGIRNGHAKAVNYILDPELPYKRFRGTLGTGYAVVDESRGTRRTNATESFRFVFIGTPGAPVVAWVAVRKQWLIRGHRYLPDTDGSIQVKGTVPGVTGKELAGYR